MHVKLSHIKGSRAGEELTLEKDRIVLGRSPSCDIIFDPDEDILVSAKHAEITFAGGECILRDLGSTNGTLHDGKKISEVRLKPGDEIELGKGGPRLIVEWDAPGAAGGDMEGKTVMMSLQEPPKPKPAATAIPPTSRVAAIPTTGRIGQVSAPTTKKGSSTLLRVVLILVIVFAAAIGGLMFLRRGGGETTATPTTAAPAGSQEIQDLQRQLREKDQQIEQLMQQLQEKNDEIERLKAQAAAPVSSGASAVPLFPERIRPSAFLIDALFEEPQEAESQPVDQMELHQVKYLKQPYKVTALRSTVRSMPGGIPRDVARAITEALASTGRFVESKAKTVPYTEVEVTDYESERETLDTKKKSQTLGKIGALAGVDVPSSPADAKTQTWNAELSAVIRVYDETGRELFDEEYSSVLRDRKTTVSGEGLKAGELFKNETPEGDVLRKVAADGVEAILSQMEGRPWISSVRSHSRDRVTIDGGRDCQIERGDVFDVVDEGTVIGRIRITSVDEDRSDAEILSGDENFRAKSISYIGRESAESRYGAEPPKMQVVVEEATSGYQGPGFSFDKAKDLPAGTRLDLLYSVGSWARVADSAGSFWVSWNFVDDVR